MDINSALNLSISQADLRSDGISKTQRMLRKVAATQRLEGVEVGPEELSIIERAVTQEISHDEASKQLNELLRK